MSDVHEQNALCLHKFLDLSDKIQKLHELISHNEEATDADLAKMEEALNRIRIILTGNGTIGVYQRIGEAEREIERMMDDFRALQHDVEKSAMKLNESIKSCREGIEWITRWLVGILGSVAVAAIVSGIAWFASHALKP